jgi:hypothetical protein
MNPRAAIVTGLIAVLGIAGCKADNSSARPSIDDAVRSRDVARVRTFTAADRVKALESAAQHGDLEGVKTLLAAGADAQSGMHTAAFMGRTEILKLLLQRGADPNRVMFASGKTPTQVAREHKHFDVVEILNEATKNRPLR